jgi:ABC-type antimicrobial peptide transport system permease subunit
MISGIIFCLIGIIVGGLISWLVSRYYYKKQADAETAKYAVMAMLHNHPVKDSKELQQRIDKYRDALMRTKKDKRGIPVWRDDGTIGVDWSLSITDNINPHDSLNRTNKEQ